MNRILLDHPNSTYDVNRQWTFNPAGQAITEALDNALYPWNGHPSGTSQVTYTADGLNRITAANANTFSYDGNGNLTSDSLTAYVYDVENRLVSASGQNTAGLRYDPFGRLYEVTDAQGGIRRLLHDGDDLVLEYGPTGTVLARHLHGLSAGDDPLISYTGANASYLDAEYLYTDRLGSVIARYRRDGTPAAINGYDEYGVPGPSSGVNNNGRFRYTGQVWLPELGLYYYKARMYSPTIGRFMQTDPIGYADGMNLYAYVGNDPVNGVDPTGLYGFDGDGGPPIVVTGGKPNPCAGVQVACISGDDVRAMRSSSILNFTFDLKDLIPFYDEIVVIGRPFQGPQLSQSTPHRYTINLLSPCPAKSVFNYFKGAEHSAPGAPAAREGFTPRINLTGLFSPNPISQSVNSNTGTIVNTTLPGHVFYPGSVTIKVTPLGAETSTITVTGVGTGEYPLFNDAVGQAWFGGTANGAANACGRW